MQIEQLGHEENKTTDALSKLVSSNSVEGQIMQETRTTFFLEEAKVEELEVEERPK